jgi:hypothetical protein
MDTSSIRAKVGFAAAALFLAGLCQMARAASFMVIRRVRRVGRMQKEKSDTNVPIPEPWN